MQPDPLRTELDRFRAPHRCDAGTERGFICILDLRPRRSRLSPGPKGHSFAGVVLLALVAILACAWVASRPAPPLNFHDDALQLTAWQSPTGFLLNDDFPPIEPD